MDNIVKLFGERVRLLRHQKKYSQERLSELAGLHPTYIGQVERAEKKCTIETAYRIASALDCTLSELLKEPDELEQRNVFDNDPQKQHLLAEIMMTLSELDTEALEARTELICGIAKL